MVSKFNRILSLLAAGLLAGCDSPNTLQLTGGEPSASPGEGGVARLHFDPGPVGMVAGRSMETTWKYILIHFEEIDSSDSSTGRERFDTLLLRGSETVVEEYRFDPGTRWRVSAKVDVDFKTLFEGDTVFAVDPGRPVDVLLFMRAMYSVGRFRVPVVDSMTKFILRIDHDTKIYYEVPKQTRVHDELEFEIHDISASPDGRLNYFDVLLVGEMWGREVVLYRMTDSIRIVSGESRYFPFFSLGLAWVGPTAPPPGGAKLTLEFENPIALDMLIYRLDTTGSKIGVQTFLDPRTGELYPYKRMGNQTWMLRNIGTECYDAPEPFESTSSECKYGTLFTDTTADVDSYVLGDVRIPPRDFRSACPAGWHVPDTSEWSELVRFAARGESDSVGAHRLRTRVNWSWVGLQKQYWHSFNGSDEFGFALRPTQLYVRGYSRSQWDEAQMFTSTPGCRVVIFDDHGYKNCSDFHFATFYPHNTFAAGVRCIKDSGE